MAEINSDMRGAPAERPVSAQLQEHSQKARGRHGHPEGQGPGPAEQPHAHDRHVGRHHDEVAVGKIDEAQDAVHHGVADGDEGIEAPQGKAVHQLL